MTERELRILRTLTNEVGRLCQEIHAIHEDQQAANTQNKNQPVEPLPIEVRTDPRLPVAIREHYESENRRRKSVWRKIWGGLEIIGIGSAFALVILNLRTLREIQKQTPAVIKAANAAENAASLNRQIAESTQAAIVNATCGQDLGYGNTYTIRCTLSNEGKSIAVNAVGDFTIELQSYPSHRSIKKYPLRISRGQLAVRGSGAAYLVQGSVFIEGLNVKSIEDGTRVVVINASASYKNGFDRDVSDQYCWQLMRMAGINDGFSGNNHWLPQLIDCNQISDTEIRNAYYAEHELKAK